MNRFDKQLERTKRAPDADRWVEEQLFEEDVRAVLRMMRPHRHEKLEGWSEYRTGGRHFRVTVSWEKDFPRPGEEDVWRIPALTEVLESLLVGAAKNGDDMSPAEEFRMYRRIIDDLRRRLDEIESCYT